MCFSLLKPTFKTVVFNVLLVRRQKECGCGIELSKKGGVCEKVFENSSKKNKIQYNTIKYKSLNMKYILNLFCLV